MKKAQRKRLLEQCAEITPLQKLHQALFPEEYDHYNDSIEDARERRRGINPMSKEYQQRVNERRAKMGVEPYQVAPSQLSCDPLNSKSLSPNQASTGITSYQYCQRRLDNQEG